MIPYFLAEILCPHLQTPANGSKSTSSVFVEALVNFTCHNGYELSGQSTLQCQVNGEWNGTAPFCSGNSHFLSPQRALAHTNDRLYQYIVA